MPTDLAVVRATNRNTVGREVFLFLAPYMMAGKRPKANAIEEHAAKFDGELAQADEFRALVDHLTQYADVIANDPRL